MLPALVILIRSVNVPLRSLPNSKSELFDAITAFTFPSLPRYIAAVLSAALFMDIPVLCEVVLILSLAYILAVPIPTLPPLSIFTKLLPAVFKKLKEASLFICNLGCPDEADVLKAI